MRIRFSGLVSLLTFLRVYRRTLPGWIRYAPVGVLITLVVASLPAKAYETFLQDPIAYLQRIPLGHDLHGLVTGTVTDSGIEWVSQIGTLVVTWPKITFYHSVPTALIIRTDDDRLLVFPPKFFATLDERHSVEKLVAARVPAA